MFLSQRALALSRRRWGVWAHPVHQLWQAGCGQEWGDQGVAWHTGAGSAGRWWPAPGLAQALPQALFSQDLSCLVCQRRPRSQAAPPVVAALIVVMTLCKEPGMCVAGFGEGGSLHRCQGRAERGRGPGKVL